MHCVQELVEARKFALEAGQHQDGQDYLSAVEHGLSKIVVDVDLDQPAIEGVLVVRVGADAADSVVALPLQEGELDHVDAVRVAVQFLFDLVGHLQVGCWKAETDASYALTVDDY